MGKKREKTIENFLDENRKVKHWPAKRKNQLMILEYLKTKFEQKTIYTEKEINELLKTWHTFSDWVLLRRELVELSFLKRENDGSKYWI